jgi:hypothetical protein
MGKILGQVSGFKYMGNTVSFDNRDIEFKIQTYNKMNEVIRQSFRTEMSREAELRLHNITSKAALTYGSENWILKQVNRQRLEAA